jgi:peptide/nickel transport system substrate-binding protein
MAARHKRCGWYIWAIAYVVGMFALPSPAAAETGDCGTLVIPTTADVTSFSPLLGSSLANGQAAQLMYASLLWISATGQIDWSRSLASAVTSPDNGLTYDITLRPWHWSDGQPVTATDVIYMVSLIRQFGPAFGGYGQGGMPNLLQTVTARDALHVRIVLTRKVNPEWFIYDGLAQIIPLPEHAWRGFSLDQMVQRQSEPSFYNVVDGPLKLAGFAPDQYVVYVPNPAYDGPKMHFDRLVMPFIESDGASIEQIEAGDIDLTSLPMEFWSGVQHLRGVHIEILPELPTWNYILLNFHNQDVGFFDDVRVRQALAEAQDQNEIIALALHGVGYAVYAPINAADAMFEAPSIAAGRYPLRFDPAGARALLRAAGYAPGPDGIMQKHGQRLSFVVLSPSGSTEQDEVDEIIQRGFRAVGIDMKIHEIAFNQMLALDNGPPQGWQAEMMGQFFAGFPSGEAMFLSGAAGNNGGYSDPTMDRLIEASISQPGLDALHAYEIYASLRQPVIFSASEITALLVVNRLHGAAGFYQAGGLAPDTLYCTDVGR